ncbi:MAG: hypothetical protein LLF96_01125 [Eubacteriales bacterium]|nr:hypothetical protein [Eubacteriales bacterium]
MRFLRVFGRLLCFIGGLVALMGVLATAVPMIENERVQSIVASFSAQGDSALLNGVNGVIQYCLDHNYFVFIVGMVMLLLGGILKSVAEKALFKSRFLSPKAEKKAESKPETQAEEKPNRVRVPRVTAATPVDTRPSFTAPKTDTVSAAPVDTRPSFTAPKDDTISAASAEMTAESKKWKTPVVAADIPEPHSLLFPTTKPTAKEMEEIVYGATTWESPAPVEAEPDEFITPVAATPEAVFAPAVKPPMPVAAIEAAAASVSRAVYTQRYAPVQADPAAYTVPVQQEQRHDIEKTAFEASDIPMPSVSAQPTAVPQWSAPAEAEYNAFAAYDEPTAVAYAARTYQPPVIPEVEPVAVPVAQVTHEARPETVQAAAVVAPQRVQVSVTQPLPAYRPRVMPEVEPAAVPIAPVTHEARLETVQAAAVIAPQRAQVRAAQPAPTNRPPVMPEAELAAVPIAPVTHEARLETIQAAAVAAPPRAQVNAAQPAPTNRPPIMPEVELNAVPVARVTREARPETVQTAAAAVAAPPRTQVSVAQPVPVKQPVVFSENTPAAVPAPYAPREAQPAAARRVQPPAPVETAYHRAANTQAEWQTKSSSNDRVIVATRQPVQARDVTPAANVPFTTVTAPARAAAYVPYAAPSPARAVAPAPAVWIGARPAPEIPPYFHTPAMAGGATNGLRTPMPPPAMERMPQPTPVLTPMPLAPVRIVSTLRGYAADEQAYMPQTEAPSGGFGPYAPLASPREAMQGGTQPAQPRIVSTMGQRGVRRP